MVILKDFGIYKEDKKNREFIYEKLKFSPVCGSLKGFIDLIFEFQGKFYLADWKSNYLGDDYASYAPESLRQAMSKSYYIVQYLIYTVALDKYLQKQLKNYSYEKHFGGVYYFFLRGINQRVANNNGVYFDRPSEVLLRQLENTF